MLAHVQAGSRDLERAAEALATRLPEPLGVFARLAYNYRWAWDPDGPDVFRALDPDRWERVAETPVKLLQEANAQRLSEAAGDDALLARANALHERVQADLARPFHTGPASEERPIAYFSAEYGWHVSFPIYSGGLGGLAGDILKEASDRAWPLTAIGLLYRNGYFRQRIDRHGWQHEYWVDTDPDRLPAALVTDDDGEPLTVSVTIGDAEVVAQIWRTDVGRVPLFLLDADRPENSETARWITSRLYIGDEDIRLAQYLLLGIGGVRALEAMGIDPSIVHLNEGHAAFVSLELARREYSGNGSLGAALEIARKRTIFTTHTPVPAGNDTYPAQQVEGVLKHMAGTLGVDPAEIIALGRTNPAEEAEPFGVTQFALRTSRAANGVSRRHGEVAREMWQAMWPENAVDDVPITYVTNGVHIPTWLGHPMWELLNRHLGEDWLDRATDPATWAPVDDIPAKEIWPVRNQQRAQLIEYVRHRAVFDRLARDEPRPYAEAAASFQPDVLTVGFARRLATYKRLNLLIQEFERALRIVNDEERPVQVLLAGKAHPRDDAGKRLVEGLFQAKDAPGFATRVAYLDDYDLRMAAHLLRGCDVWITLPRPPLEASGTSGMKNVVNGGLQLSVLDGWWAEGYDGGNGWSLSGDVDHDHGAQDARHAHELFRLLEEEVAPEFYRVTSDGIARDWVARIRRSLRTLGPAFGAGRMLEDYEKKVYKSGL